MVCILTDINLKGQTELKTTFQLCASLYFNVFQKCVAYTGNNMRKQTPAPDKKEKDVSSLCFLFLPDTVFV